MKKTGFAANVLLMTSSMLIIRLVTMSANIYISEKAGAEIMGLYHVIFSTFSFAITVSISGTNLAATRLVSEYGVNEIHDFGPIIKHCLAIALCTSVLAATVLLLGARGVSKTIIKDDRCIPALRLLALTLPLIASSAVIKGALLAKRKVVAITISQIAEDFSAILITIALLKNYSHTPYAHMAIVAGNFLSEITAFCFDIIMYRFFFGVKSIRKASTSFQKVLGICMPVAAGSYLRSALVAIENVLIPIRLASGGVANPLEEYGIVRAMAMQLLLFPTVFIQSFASMLVPEMSEMNAAYRKNGISHVASVAIELIMIFAFGVAAVFVKFHNGLANHLYTQPKVEEYLGLLSLLVIPMYLDTVVDSMLKGLNDQVMSLKFNIIDSCLRIPAVWLIVPVLGIRGYILILYASEIFNLSLSLGRLIYVAKVKISITRCVILPFFCATVSICAINVIPIDYLWSQIAVFGVVYLSIEFFASKILRLFFFRT